MSCLTASVSRVSPGLEVEFKKLNPTLKANFSTSGLSVNISMVCSINTTLYVRANPQVAWLTRDNDFSKLIDIESNVIWEVDETD